MFSAILMAGYKNKMEVKRYSKIVAEHYGEKFIETGYLPLREFKVVINGKLAIRCCLSGGWASLSKNLPNRAA
jgi:hypothetical protein